MIYRPEKMPTRACRCGGTSGVTWRMVMSTKGTETAFQCLACGVVHTGAEEWDKSNTPPAPAPYVDPDAVTFKDFTAPIPQGGFVTTYKRWYVVCVSGQLPHLIDGMTGERVELKP